MIVPQHRRNVGGAVFTPIMDTVTHTARGAYSLRQLYAAATYSVRLTNSAGSVTEDIGFIDGVSDTVAIDNFISTHGTAYIEIWYDQSPHGRDLSLSNSNTTRPTVTWDATKLKHRPTFPGYIESAAETLIPQPLQAFVVAELNSDIDNIDQHIFSSVVVTAGRYIVAWRGGTSNALACFAGTTQSSAGSYTTFSSSQLTYTLNGASSSIRKDGTAIMSANMGTAGLDGVLVGDVYFATVISRPWRGHIDELIICDELSTGDRDAIEEYQDAYK